MLIFNKTLAPLTDFVVITQNKDDSEKDERRDEERQKSKRGRPPSKSALSSNLPYGLSKAPNSEGKSGTRSACCYLPDSSPLSNGMEGAQF